MNNNTFILQKGGTSQSINVFIADSTHLGNPDQIGRIGLTFSTVKVTYCLPQENDVAVTLVTQTPSGAYSSGGFVQIDGTNMPGYYRFDPPDACFSTSNRFCSFLFHPGSDSLTPTPAVVNIHHTTDIQFGDVREIRSSAQRAIDFDSILSVSSSLAFHSDLRFIRGSSDDADAFHDIITASSSFAIQADIRMIHGSSDQAKKLLDIVTASSSGSIKSDMIAIQGTSAVVLKFHNMLTQGTSRAILADVEFINQSSDAANKSGKYFNLMQVGTVNDAGPTATSFISTITSSDANRYLGQALAFTTGPLVGQAREVTEHTTNLGLQMSAGYNQVPVNGNEFMILPTVPGAGSSDVNMNSVHGSSDMSKRLLDIITASSSSAFHADMKKVSGSSDAAVKSRLFNNLIQTATVNDAGATATSWISTLTSSDAGRFDGQTMAFTTGALEGQSRRLIEHTTNLGVKADVTFTEPPANGNSFIVLPFVAGTSTVITGSGDSNVNVNKIHGSSDAAKVLLDILNVSSSLHMTSNPWDLATTDHNTALSYGNIVGNFSAGSSDTIYQHVSRRNTAI